jgi:hypothetical protein
MFRKLFSLSLFLALSITAPAEELVLKDGTKIFGKMTAVNGDKIEVETAYGKMQINRADIVSISFPENNPGASPSTASATKEPPKIDETLDGTQYLNKTAHFSLTLPVAWKINSSLRSSAEVLAALSSTDSMRYLIVIDEPYTGSADSYKGLVEIQAKRNLENYEKLTETPTTIDGKSAMLLSYRGISPAAQNLPIQFLVAIIPSTDGYTRVTTWCVEPLFNETQGTFEKIIRSYHAATEPAKKP